jgi:AhpD family alkylhydroperoxidase
MQARMKNPVMIFPKAMQAMLALNASTEESGLPKSTIKLVHLRVSQINGCSLCVDMHAREMRHEGEAEDRLFAVAAWRDAPYFTDAERAALALAECVTRLSDRPDPVPDDIWNEAARHYDEKGLAALLLTIAAINVWNRLNVPTRQIAGDWTKSAEAREWMEKHVFAQTA